MKTITTLVAVIVLLILGVALLNWNLVTQPTSVNLFVTTVNLSMPLLLLIGMVIVAVLYFATLGRIRMEAAIESRELHRELDRARRTAEKAEESRVADLRAYLDREIPQIELKLDQVLDLIDARSPIMSRTDAQR